eukprot:gb/GEZN01017936.1/.p1 GENE.gb/GEZN01017936.1/~~gb/GEZN01017936.1/.p1  ORF type:complete len:176 (+),score=32.23 gb/GEZN01017936.1/:58-585(+)
MGDAKTTLEKLPLCTIKAGPRDGDKWKQRYKEELKALIQLVEMNKKGDNDWFHIESNANGIRWTGRCWYIYELVKYEFDLEFEIPVSYPSTAFEIVLPELDGKTAKMYRGGKICLSAHFKPLWAKNVPRFGIAHALVLGLASWLAAEVPDLVARGILTPPATQAKLKTPDQQPDT